MGVKLYRKCAQGILGGCPLGFQEKIFSNAYHGTIFWGSFGGPWKRPGSLSGASSGVLADKKGSIRFLGSLGAVLEPLGSPIWASLGPPWPPLVLPWLLLALIGRYFGKLGLQDPFREAFFMKFELSRSFEGGIFHQI